MTRSTLPIDNVPATRPTVAKAAIIADFRASMAELKCIGSERLVRQGISMTQLHVMHLLDHHGEMPMSRLAEMLDVSLSNGTGLIDRVEERGFVERTRIPTDRRMVMVRLTPAGRQMLDEIETVRERDSCAACSTDSIRRSSQASRRPWPTFATRSLATATGADARATTATCPKGGTENLWKHSPLTPTRGPTLEEDPALGLSHREKLEILFAVMLGLFLGALDQTIVGPALPTIVTQLSGNDYYVWAITIYLLTSTISVPFWGKLSDLYGRKPIFMIGIVIFLIGSALSGLSQNMAMLILFRGIQGIGAGSLFPVALAVIGDLFTPAGARQVPGPLRGRVRHRLRRRPAHRRLADREPELALDLLRQHPDRDRRARS